MALTGPKSFPAPPQGNYWVVETSGATCNITGELKNGSNRGCLTGVIIEKIENNQAPVANDATFAVSENSASGTAVGTVSATDPNAGDTLTYAITAGNTGGAFAINSGTGAITTAAALDHEASASYALTVTVTDDGNPALSDTATITVNVTNVNEAPSASDTSGSVAEDVSVGTSVATVTATDPDAGDTLSYAITAGNTGGAFAIDSSGNITTATALDYETTASYTLTVTVTDSGSLTDTATVNVTVTDVAEATGPKLVRTTVNNVSSAGWTSVNLGQSYNSAVIIATPMYPNSSVAPVVTRIRNVSGSGFEVKLDRADGQTGTVTMDVSVVAVEEGVYTVANDGVKMEAVKYTSTVTGAKNAWTAENRSYQNSYTSPVVVGQVMSANDADWSAFWCHGSSRTNPPDGSNLNVGKMVAEDPDTTRADETVGYIVIESGSGAINGINYTAGLGSDTVRGVDNTSVGYNYSLSGLGSASAAAVSLAGLDGGDGGWAVLYGPSPLSSTTLTLAVDEDQLSNSERNHTTEQLGYIVFE